MSATRRWRPALRQFYKRVHPDVSHLASARAQRENAASLAALEGALQQRPSAPVKLRFHVLGQEDRASVATIRSAVIPSCVNDRKWEAALDRQLLILVQDVVGDQFLPEHARPKRRRRFQKRRRSYESASRASEPISSLARELGFTHEYDLLREEQMEMNKPIFDESWMKPLPGQELSKNRAELIERMFIDGRIHCDPGGDVDVSLQFALNALKAINFETLSILETALMRDFYIEVTNTTTTGRKGIIIHVNPAKSSSLDAGREISKIIRSFTDDHIVRCHQTLHRW